MRTKSSAKRQAILDVAAQVFRQLGFEGASMGEIRARVGGSKATLYNYFSSKEELFFEVIFSSIAEEFETTHAYLDPNENIAEALTIFGEGLLRSLYGRDRSATLDFRRIPALRSRPNLLRARRKTEPRTTCRFSARRHDSGQASGGQCIRGGLASIRVARCGTVPALLPVRAGNSDRRGDYRLRPARHRRIHGRLRPAIARPNGFIFRGRSTH